MIRWLLLLLVALFWTTDVLTGDFSLAPGLSVKNAMLYAIAAALFLRKVMGDTSPVRLTRIVAYFAVWIGYAAASVVFAGLVMHYPEYHVTEAAIALKSQLVDPAVFCLAVFYGLRGDADVKFFLKGLIGAVCLANILTLASVAGLVHLAVRIGTAGAEYGRVFGFFGHANETGEMIACLLPAMIAISSSGGRLSRTLWCGATLASAIVYILTVSRGAYVATVVSTLCGAYLCRRYVNVSRLLGGMVVALAVLVIAVALACVIDPTIAGVLRERFLGESLAPDLGAISSGRTDIWWYAVLTMASAPLTFVTGFGWYAYQTMGFHFGTHNYYLELLFDLGLPGLLMFVLIMRRSLVLALQAMDQANEEERRYLIAFVFGLVAFVVGEFFAVLSTPVPYLFMYMGVMLHAAVTLRSRRMSVEGSERVEGEQGVIAASPRAHVHP